MYVGFLKNNNEKNRNVSLDIARTLAIMCVVLCHCTESIYGTSIYEQRLSIQSEIFKLIAFTIGRYGVPLFLFISGALILKKQIENDDDVFKFYKNNLIPLLITTELWIIIYNIFLYVMGIHTISIKSTIKEMLFLKSTEISNMWYMPVIIGIYIVIPFLAKVVKTFSAKSLIPIIAITLIYTSALDTLNVIRDILGLSSYYYILNLNLFGGIYGIYIILGYLIYNKEIFRNIKTYICCIISAVCFIFTVGLQLFAYECNKVYYIWYQCIFLVISSALLFEILKRIKISNTKIQYVSMCISRVSLAIFFLHIVIINLIN